MRYCLVLALALLVACQNPGAGTAAIPDSVPRNLPKKTVDLLAYPAPALSGYQFMGDGKLEVSQRRVFVYQDTGSDGARLQLAIYAIPEGWDDMAPTRLVAGHYGQVRESLIQHLLRSSNDELELLEDRLVDSAALAYPIGFAQMIQHERAAKTRYTLMLSAHQPLFVRMEHIDGNGDGLNPQQAQALMENVIAQLFGRPQPASGSNSDSNGTSTMNDSTVDTSTDAATAEASR
ncbi:MAG: hypothetical protein P1U64_04585 [Alcanivoracaceae bacterium]|nr:hypothetical protein [Alcanivoracaceae bacterium]